MIKKFLKKLINKAGYSVYRNSSFPIGLDVRKFIQKKNKHIAIIFDVGANVGQTSEYFSEMFDAEIYAFEPVRDTFEKLRSRNFRNVRCFNFAFGESDGECVMHLKPRSALNSLSPKNNLPTNESQFVAVKTIDNFCLENDICRIDILKTDAEGYDLNVLMGAERMLKDGKVQFVFAEATMNDSNIQNSQWKEIDEYLRKYHYELQGFFDQSSWAGSNRMDQFNVLYEFTG